MRKKTEKTFKAVAEKLAKYLRWHFFANVYKMDLVWAITEYGPSFGYGRVAASIEIDEAYLNFQVTFYRGAYDAYLRGEFFEEVLLHEFCHLVTQPFAEALMRHATPELEPVYKQLVERQTELIAKLLKDGDIAKLKEHEK